MLFDVFAGKHSHISLETVGEVRRGTKTDFITDFGNSIAPFEQHLTSFVKTDAADEVCWSFSGYGIHFNI